MTNDLFAYVRRYGVKIGFGVFAIQALVGPFLLNLQMTTFSYFTLEPRTQGSCYFSQKTYGRNRTYMRLGYGKLDVF